MSLDLPTSHQYAFDHSIAETFENMILYRMCHDYPGHTDKDVVAGKIIAIGRIYSASPERGAGSAQIPEIELHKAIAGEFIDRRLDELLDTLPFATRLSESVLDEVVLIHDAIVEWIASATAKWSSRTVINPGEWKPRRQESFASKYLHFHRPNAFPISDRFMRIGLQCKNKRSPASYRALCGDVLQLLGQNPTETLRSIDSKLVKAGRVHDARGSGPCPNCKLTKRPRRSKQFKNV